MKYFSCCLLFILSLSACTGYKEVQIKSIERMSGFRITPGQLDVELKVLVYNPNNYKIKVRESNLQFFLDETKLGDASFKDDIELKANTEEVYTIGIVGHFTTDINEILKNLGPKMLFGKPMLHIRGNLKASARGLSKSLPVEHSEVFSLFDKP